MNVVRDVSRSTAVSQYLRKIHSYSYCRSFQRYWSPILRSYCSFLSGKHAASYYRVYNLIQ